ncbi:MAG: hypothetical protein WHV66_14785, partial [Anaerolineales bacterium]
PSLDNALKSHKICQSIRELIRVLLLIAAQIFGDWAGNVLSNLLKINDISWVRVLPATIIGAFFTAYLGEKLKKQAVKEPENISSNSKNDSTLIGIGLSLSVIPMLFRWCEDNTLVEKATNFFASLIPLAVGIGQASRISTMLDRLYSVSHNFLDTLSLSSYRIRDRWLYKYLLAHPAAKDFDQETLRRFSGFKVGLWARERKDYQIVHRFNETIAERLT